MDRPEKWLAAAEPDADESDFSAVSFQLYAKRRLDVLFEVAGRLKVADRKILCKLTDWVSLAQSGTERANQRFDYDTAVRTLGLGRCFTGFP